MAIYPYFEDIHEDVRKTAWGAAEEFKKTAAEADEKVDYSIVEKNLKRLGKLSLLGLCIPEKYGGQGLDVISYVLAVEELAKTCASTVASYNGQSLTSFSIDYAGAEEQKMKYLPPLCADKIGAFALTEPMAESDADASEIRAALQGNTYIINGTKRSII